MQKCKSTGLSLPQELFEIVEAKRGDISRSRFLLRIIEKTLENEIISPEGQTPNHNSNAGAGNNNRSPPSKDSESVIL